MEPTLTGLCRNSVGVGAVCRGCSVNVASLCVGCMADAALPSVQHLLPLQEVSTTPGKATLHMQSAHKRAHSTPFIKGARALVALMRAWVSADVLCYYRTLLCCCDITRCCVAVTSL
jgi:hypothetical protein